MLLACRVGGTLEGVPAGGCGGTFVAACADAVKPGDVMERTRGPDTPAPAELVVPVYAPAPVPIPRGAPNRGFDVKLILAVK